MTTIFIEIIFKDFFSTINSTNFVVLKKNKIFSCIHKQNLFQLDTYSWMCLVFEIFTTIVTDTKYLGEKRGNW